MGFFNNVIKGAGKILKGDIKAGVNTITGNGSSGTGRNTQAEAEAIILQQLVEKYLTANKLRGSLFDKQKALAAVTPSLQNADVKAMIAKVKAELDKGASVISPSVNSIANQLITAAVTGVAGGLTSGLGTQVSNGITKLGEQILGSTKASSIKDQLGNFFGGVANTALWTTIKKNWYIAIPVAGFGIWILVKLIQMLSGNTRKSGKGYRTK